MAVSGIISASRETEPKATVALRPLMPLEFQGTEVPVFPRASALGEHPKVRRNA